MTKDELLVWLKSYKNNEIGGREILAAVDAYLSSSQTIAKPIVGSSLSPMYRLMIYFAHSTMVMYAADIVCHDKMTVAEFREQNEAVCKRVFDEGLSIMNYELSYEQVSRACYVYLQSKYFPQSVKTSKVYTPS